jgi:hypothetical protein
MSRGDYRLRTAGGSAWRTPDEDGNPTSSGCAGTRAYASVAAYAASAGAAADYATASTTQPDHATAHTNTLRTALGSMLLGGSA